MGQTRFYQQKMLYINKMEWYSDIKKEEIMKSVVRWVDLESIVLRDVGLT